MTKSELMETYTAEQLAEMVVKLNNAMDSLKYSDSFLKSGLFDNPAVAVLESRLNIAQNRINNLEEDNGRLQAKLDTYNNYLLPRCTKEAKELIDQNHFTGVRIVTWEQWNNREESEGKGSVYIPKEYEQTMREILDIDTSEIQDDCHRFGIERLQRYLKNPAPIKIPKRDSENIDLSKIQKCQEEYEKLLKENPIHSTIDTICKDIMEQKNNTMAMEFTRIICDLLKRYGVYVHCTETKLSEKITTNSIEEQYGIVFDSMDFSQHDKEFTDRIKELEEELEKSNRKHAKTLWEFCDSVKKEDYDSEVNRLKSEVEKYRKAFEGAKKERDCQAAECRKKIKEMDDRAILEFPTEPIDVANFLINGLGASWHYDSFDVSELRQIAEHLLVYCNHNGEME